MGSTSILRQLLLRQQNRSYMDIHRSSLKWYAFSAASVGVALLVSLRLGGAISSLNSGPFLLAVIASALVGGTGPGLIAAGLSLATRCSSSQRRTCPSVRWPSACGWGPSPWSSSCTSTYSQHGDAMRRPSAAASGGSVCWRRPCPNWSGPRGPMARPPTSTGGGAR